MNNGQPLTADEMLDKIFHCMSKIVVEKDFSKSLILLTDLGRTLVNAHRASFWYRDEKQKQYWTMAASGIERITIPMGTGIVGASIENNETILINNPYEDPRFNPDVDKKTGYLTKSILCMPVSNSNGKVIGAYQVINKMGEEEKSAFDDIDVKYLALAAGYCGKTLEAYILKEQNKFDQLTGLMNRKGFYNSYNSKILSLPDNVVSSVIIGDIDFFKKVNDAYGHNVGDDVLVYISKIIEECVGDIGEVFRWGGEEFLILMPECSLSRANNIADNIRLKVETSECKSEGATVKVTMSFGVAEIDVTKESADNIKVADDNLYTAKQEGRNRVVSNKEFSKKQILIIPDINDMEASLELADKDSLGFEFNDFFNPDILNDDDKLQELIEEYGNYKLPEYCTMHGAFYDVIPFSVDQEIREISLRRIEQSIEHATKLGVKGVVFHTNYNPFLNAPKYIENWIDQNAGIWREILNNHPDMSIYLENMFDTIPDIMVELSKRLSDCPNYGICLDYAHAALTKVNPEEWAQKLGPYIKHIHINDNDLISDLHLAWGDGKIDRNGFYRCYDKYMDGATILIETSSLENKIRSLEVLKADGFI